MNSVRLDKVSKSYGSGAPSVSVDLAIAEGEFFTLLGPSGCGKSTTLRMIAGFVQPTVGAVYFGDRDVTALPPHRRDTGMVFQNYALFPHLTVAQNVAYGLAVRKTAKAEKTRRVELALEQVGLAGHGARRIDQLSGGQQQRVALARAIVISPSVLLLDEPLSNLDAKLREETRKQIRSVQQKAGTTAVYVTHDQTEAMAMSDRVAVLDAGTLHQVGPPEEIYHRPATEFVAKFIGRSNTIPVEVVHADPCHATVRLPDGTDLTVPAPPWEPSAGNECALSLRPEELSFCSPQEGLLRGTVTATEFSGATSSFDVETDGLTITVTAAERSDRLPSAGEQVGVTVDPARTWLVRR